MSCVFIKVSFFAMAVVLGVVQLHAQSPDSGRDDVRWDNGIRHSTWDVVVEAQDRKRMLSLWETIGRDLETETHPLAGTFLKGGYSSGYFLRWSVAKGFIVVPYFDQNLIADYGYGRVTIVDESDVIFTPEKDLNGGRGLEKMPRRWTAILGYFVPVESLSDFGKFRAGLGLYNEFNGRCCEFSPEFLAQRIDRSALTFPTNIPARYKTFITDPITGTITTVGKPRAVRDWGYQGTLYGEWMDKAILTPVNLDVGQLQGVKKNMLFRMVGEPYFERYVQVRTVGPRSSTAYVVQDISSGGAEGFYRDDASGQDKPLPSVRPGARVTTGTVRQ